MNDQSFTNVSNAKIIYKIHMIIGHTNEESLLYYIVKMFDVVAQLDEWLVGWLVVVAAMEIQSVFILLHNDDGVKVVPLQQTNKNQIESCYSRIRNESWLFEIKVNNI